LCWIVLWAMTTAGDTRGIVTASTESMLTTRLRAELRKWFRLFRGQTFFELTSTTLISRDVAHEQTWRFTRPPHRGGGRTYNFATSKKGSAPFHRSSFEMRCTVPVPIPSDLATFKIPRPFASCFRTFRSVSLSMFGRPRVRCALGNHMARTGRLP
jgi:hypothetical protein